MRRKPLPSDLRGVSRLAIDATVGLTDLVEALHHSILLGPAILLRPAPGRTRGITGLVYRSIRGVTRLVGGSIDALLSQLAPWLGAGSGWAGRESLLAALNGVLGDYLERTGNPLAIEMRLCSAGQPLALERQALAEAIPHAGGKLLVLAHGLCMNDLQWLRAGHNHGSALAHALGYTPVHLYYNSGLHISRNGRAFSELLEALVAQWPVPLEELVILGHSMGGLVARSACHYGSEAGHRWRTSLRALVFLGTPHHGAPLERGGHWVDVLLGVSPYTSAIARLGKIRSAGITDLRHGSLLDEDWQGQDRFAHAADTRRPVPLPAGVACYAIAATPSEDAGERSSRRLDGLVPLASALGQHADPARALGFAPSHQWIAHRTNHLGLLSSTDVYARIERWLAAEPAGRRRGRARPAKGLRQPARRKGVSTKLGSPPAAS